MKLFYKTVLIFLMFGLFCGCTKQRISGPLPGMEFVLIPAGSFQMGSSEGNDNEKPIHEVTLQPFYMMTTEVTQIAWKDLMGSNPSHFTGNNLPVESISWEDCQEFIWTLNKKYPGKDFRLPTEAEWEYACRAGTTTRYYSGDKEFDLDQVAWYKGNSGKETHPVGGKTPNNFGLYDMHGNVWEFCEDWYHDSYSDAPFDGSAWLIPSGHRRVIRGGSCCKYADELLSVTRGGDEGSHYTCGFRLAMNTR